MGFLGEQRAEWLFRSADTQSLPSLGENLAPEEGRRVTAGLGGREARAAVLGCLCRVASSCGVGERAVARAVLLLEPGAPAAERVPL